MMKEDELLGWLRLQAAQRGWHLIGDDAAELPAASYLTTVDTQIAGVHFVEDLDPRLIARRLLAVNLSDLAAMGAEPAFAFLALSAPPEFAFRRFFAAMMNACVDYGVELAGGDLSAQPRLTAALTLLGRPQGRVLKRDGGRAGHVLWLGGSVGESALGCHLVSLGARLAGEDVSLPVSIELTGGGLNAAHRAVRRHLEPAPQLELGRWLANHGEDGAVMDISDGLSLDLHRLCRASGVGAEIEIEAIEGSAAMQAAAMALDLPWQNLALGGGEDYVLLFSLPPDLEPPQAFSCHRLGILTAGLEIRLRQADGHSELLPPTGFDHLLGAKAWSSKERD